MAAFFPHTAKQLPIKPRPNYSKLLNNQFYILNCNGLITSLRFPYNAGLEETIVEDWKLKTTSVAIQPEGGGDGG